MSIRFERKNENLIEIGDNARVEKVHFIQGDVYVVFHLSAVDNDAETTEIDIWREDSQHPTQDAAISRALELATS